MSSRLRRGSSIAAVALALGLAACATEAGTDPQASPSPTTASAQCPVGDWRSTQVAAGATAGAGSAALQGGAGVMMTVQTAGAVRADFSGMQPIMFTAQAAAAEVKGDIVYAGPIEGNLDLAGSAGAMTGAWRPNQTVKWDQLKLTVKITSPIAVTVVDNVTISQVTGSQTTQAGNAVDLQPLLREGTYRCDGNDTLVVNPTGGGPNVMWTFQRENK